ncbi:hypothetical protein [Mesorhizobium sp. L-8-10]|uniref:hypothetical protein n=1 Tax=Mesorhizobium sp. L-8-10 TaxID=2744523 RepID=UPI0019253D7F|nr:hypothetical protein [Mesorhizobium sp. L-8-10]
MTAKFVFRRMSADEFKQALDRAKMSINDFMFVTGRHSHGVSKYLDPNDATSPTLSEIVLLELAAEKDEYRRRMIEIADSRMVEMGHRKDRR